MNKQRRSQIVAAINEFKLKIENIKDDEEFAFDNLPPGFQESLRGQNMQDCIDTMDEALEMMDDAIDLLEGVLI